MKWLLAFLVGCNPAWGPGAGLNPASNPATWEGRVEAAANVWNDALPLCGEVFHIDYHGYPVKLVANPDWPSTTMGRFDGDSVQVRVNLGEGERPVLVHELGHALGLEHVDPAVDPVSIMRPAIVLSNVSPSEGDIARAYAQFGCD